MPDFFTSAATVQHLPELITAASAGPYAVFALVLVVIGAIASFWAGKTSKPYVRLAGMVVSTIGCLVIAILTWSLARQPAPARVLEQAPAPVAAKPAPQAAARATQETHGSQSPAIGSMSNASINYGQTPKENSSK